MLTHPGAPRTAEHPDSTANGCKVLRTGTQAKEFLIQNDLDPDAIALFDFSQMYGAEGELTEHGRKRIAAGTTGRGRGRGLSAHTAVLPPAVARRSARPQQARAPRARSG